MNNAIEIYTDGACRGNPGPGGWGAVIYYGEGAQENLKGAEPNTTNNRMELLAAIQALTHLKTQDHITLYTDSTYLKKGITEWMEGWKRKNWRTANKSPVKNQDLWQQIDQLNTQHHIQWAWVKGHSGNTGNDLADALANAAIDEMLEAN